MLQGQPPQAAVFDLPDPASSRHFTRVSDWVKVSPIRRREPLHTADQTRNCQTFSAGSQETVTSQPTEETTDTHTQGINTLSVHGGDDRNREGQPGQLFEFICGPDMRAMCEAGITAARDWDGTDPVTVIDFAAP